MTQYQHDDMPSTGMFVFHYECILCTTFALMFMSFYYVHQYVICLKKKCICMSIPLSICRAKGKGSAVVCDVNENVFICSYVVCTYAHYCHVVSMQGVPWSFSALKYR